MLSKCPNCQKETEHEDYLFEVNCTCGSRYNPFMQMENDPLMAGLAPDPVEAPAENAAQFAESAAAFAEIRDFVEQPAGSLPSSAPLEPEPTLGGAPEATPMQMPRSPAAIAPGGDRWCTTAEALPGFRIESVLGPVSAGAALAWDGSDPLRPALDKLWQEAVARGANGCVAVRAVMSPDGTKVVVLGTAVRCAPEGR